MPPLVSMAYRVDKEPELLESLKFLKTKATLFTAHRVAASTRQGISQQLPPQYGRSSRHLFSDCRD